MSPSRNLPWPCLLVALIAFLAVLLTAAAKVPLLLPIVLAVVASYAVRARLPEGPLVLLAGLVLLLAALFLTPDPGDDGPLQIGPARTRNLFAMAASIGVLLQFWVRRPSDTARAPLYVVLFGALAVAASCNTYEERYARFVIPAFAVASVLALRATRPRRRLTARSAVPVALALALAGAVGATGNAVFLNYRSQIAEWGNRLGNDRGESELASMNEQPQLGPMFGQRGSSRRVLRLNDYRGDGHLRGLSFWHYESGRWAPPLNARVAPPYTGDESVAPIQGRRGASTLVDRLAPDNPIVYAPLSARSIVFDDVEKVDWNQADGGPMVVRRGGPDAYTFYALGGDGQGLFAPPMRPGERDVYLTVPDYLRAPLTRIARQATAGARTDRQRIERLEAYLMAKHPYSLYFRPGRGDPVLNFVTREGAGAHCEFFASAATLMLRCLGIPARYVTGFYAHEPETSRTMVVRQRDAHAWTEAYVGGVGWVTVEATPPTGMPDVQASSSHIEWWRTLAERFQDVWSLTRNYLAELNVDQVASLALAPIAVVGLVLLLRRRRRKPTGAAGGYPAPAELAALAVRFERLLARRGIPAPPSVPWSEHLARLTDHDPAFREAAAAFVARYDAVRFGSDADRDALERALERAAQVPLPTPAPR